MSTTRHVTAHGVRIFGSLWRHRALVRQLAVRDVLGRYRGSVLGLLWSFFSPVLMLLVYTFVFSVVFRMRWGTGDESKAEFALILFAGLIVHGLFAECVNRAPGLITAQPNYVKKVVFPLETLPWMAMGSALFHAAISIVVLEAAFFIIHFRLNWTILLMPLVLLPFVLLIMGLCWFLAATGVFLRDLGQITGVITAALLFLAPIFYPLTALPEGFRPLAFFNPLTFIVEQTRNLLIWGRPPHWIGLGAYLAVALIVAWGGLYWFQRTRRAFADVL